MAHAGVTIALRSSGVNSKAGPIDHAEIRDRFLVPRSKDTRVDFNAKRWALWSRRAPSVRPTGARAVGIRRRTLWIAGTASA